MKIESMLFIYIAICISMIVFNIVYVFILRHNDRRLDRGSAEYDSLIRLQMQRIDSGLGVEEHHKKKLRRELSRTAGLTAFDRSMEAIYAENPERADAYLLELYPVFVYLSAHYHGRDTIKRAYFPYIVGKYNILKYKEDCEILARMFELLRSDNLYCRENALGAIYETEKPAHVVRALKLIDENPCFHHPKLICDGLLRFSGDRDELGALLWANFEGFSTGMQLNISNFLRFADIRCDGRMFALLMDEKRDQELRFAAMRYFEKFPCPEAMVPLQDFADNMDGRPWEYQSIATSALKSYPDARTAEILKKNLSNSNWYIRRNAAISCDALGFSYSELIQVFDGGDRYAREMLRYRFDRRKAEREDAGT